MILINLHLSLGSRADQDVYIYKFPGGPLRPLNFHSLLEKTIILAGIYNPKFQLSRVFIGVGETPNGAVWLQNFEPQFIVISFQRIVLKSFFNQGVVNQSKSSPLSFGFFNWFRLGHIFVYLVNWRFSFKFGGFKSLYIVCLFKLKSSESFPLKFFSGSNPTCIISNCPQLDWLKIPKKGRHVMSQRSIWISVLYIFFSRGMAGNCQEVQSSKIQV